MDRRAGWYSSREDGEPDPITAADLSDLLREHAVPIVVLNACQSAMLDAGARDPFASVGCCAVKCATAALLVEIVWKYFGFHVALFVAGRQGIGDEVLDAAKSTGPTVGRPH